MIRVHRLSTLGTVTDPPVAPDPLVKKATLNPAEGYASIGIRGKLIAVPARWQR